MRTIRRPGTAAGGRRNPRALVVVALLLLAATGCTEGSHDPGATGSDTRFPRDAQNPGDVVGYEPLRSTPPHARGWKMSYVTTGVEGSPVTATAMLVVPSGPPDGAERPLVVWAHPTRGLADRCAPSREGADTIALLEEMLAQGWAVVAPDYEGLGSDGTHPYLVGSSEGRSVLDAARAATHLSEASLSPLSPVALWGFSQGGHAVAFAAQMASGYAPELDLRAVAVAAPVTDVVHFAQRAERRDDQFGVLAVILAGYEAAYDDVDPADVLNDAALERLPVVHHGCMDEVIEAFRAPPEDQLRNSVLEVPALHDRMAENLAGLEAVQVPVLVVQGTEDDTVDPADTAALVDRWCLLGVEVDYVVRPGAGHAVRTDDLVPGWLAERLAGVALSSGCGG